MNRILRLVILALATGLLTFGVTWWLAPRPAETDEIAWVAREFALTPEQAAEVERLHDAYTPLCVEHCRLIAENRQRHAAAATPEERQAALAEQAALVARCEAATRDHLQAVAAVMPPDQGERFLALVGPKVTHHDHAAPLGLK